MANYLSAIYRNLIFINYGCLSKIIENPSVAAFIGAFSAFILVILTDWRRNRRKKVIINNLIQSSERLTTDKMEAIENTIIALEKESKLIGGPLMEYSIEDIKKLKLEILNYFKLEEKIALDTICYHMSEIDNLIKQTVIKVDDLKNSNKITKEEQTRAANVLLIDYKDILANLIRVKEMCTFYINKKYSYILNRKYKGSDYYK